MTPSSFLDGDYGPNTATQVKNFQHWFPPASVDGVVGPATWKLMCSGGYGYSIAGEYLSKPTYVQACN